MNLTNLVSSIVRKYNCRTMLVAAALLIATLPGEGMGLLTPMNLPYAVALATEDNPSVKAVPIAAPSTDMTKGAWTSQETRDKYCVRFGESNERHSWGITECFDKTAFEKKQRDLFVLTRETGTLTLQGVLDQAEGEGTYEFVEDAGFSKFLAGQNISSRDENFLFHLFLANVKKEYVNFLKTHHAQISGEQLLQMAIHGITQKQYQIYITLFEQYSGKKPGISEIVEAKIHGLDQAYIEELRASGFTDLSMRKMMETKIHGVNAAFINELKKAGFSNLTIDEILSAKIHGVNSEYIEQMGNYGFTNLSLNKLSEAKIHGVNAAYIEDLKKAGFANVSINKLIDAKIHGVNAHFIQEAKSKGYNLETLGEYVSLKIHGFARNKMDE